MTPEELRADLDERRVFQDHIEDLEEDNAALKARVAELEKELADLVERTGGPVSAKAVTRTYDDCSICRRCHGPEVQHACE